MNSVDLKQYIQFSHRKLGNRVDGSGTLIFDHGVRVCAQLYDIFQQTKRVIDKQEKNILIAALFHDVLEDTPARGEEITAVANADVLKLTEELTISFENKTITEAIQPLYSISEKAFLIKLSDILDNALKSQFVIRNNGIKFYHSFFMPLLAAYEKWIGTHKGTLNVYKQEGEIFIAQVNEAIAALKNRIAWYEFGE